MAKRPDKAINTYSCHMCHTVDCYGECQEKNEKSPDLDHNLSKSEMEQGFIKDEQSFDEPGSTERRDRYGNVVSHQDNRTMPHNKNLEVY